MRNVAKWVGVVALVAAAALGTVAQRAGKTEIPAVRFAQTGMAAAQGAGQAARHGIQVENIDRSVRPGDDFYEYSNGAWLKRTTIPPDRAGVNVFSELNDIANKNTAAIIEEAARSVGAGAGGQSQTPFGPMPSGNRKTAPQSSGQTQTPFGPMSLRGSANLRKIADLYNAYMDEEGIEKRGLEPVKERLAAIAAIQDKRELARALGETLRQDVDPLNNTNYHTANLFGLWVAPGFEDYQHYNAYLLQGGLEMPDRAYYLSDSEHMKEVRAKYQTHVATMMKLAGFDEAEQRAGRIVELETAIAKTHRTLAENEDIHKANNVWTIQDFKTKAPGLDWDEYFAAAGVGGAGGGGENPHPSRAKNGRDEARVRGGARVAGTRGNEKFDVWQPEAFTGEAALVEQQPLEAWKDWLAFHLIEDYGGVLPKAIAEERFGFFGKTLSGVQQQRPRAQRGVIMVSNVLGDAVGQIYAQRYFSAQAKAEAEAMVKQIIEAFRKRIDALKWMAPATKAEAKAKLGTLYVGIGYPEKWRDYSKYEVKADDAFGNAWRADLFDYQYWVGRLGTQVDRQEWSMTPQTVNAVNLPLQNALNFPAAVLQPPFYDPQAPAAANFGAIGTIIGHEISHTFDTEGATFDAQGRLRNWWTDADLKHFEEVTNALAKQYDQYHPFPDLAVNGRQTLAENIADVAGISAALDGWRASLNGKPAPVQQGFSGEQQFFIAYGQNWASKTREASLRQQVLTDPHAPGMYRAATVRNIDAWYAAFEVKAGEKLYLGPEQRVKIW